MAQNFYDVFNGDADGICALHQLRLAEPRPEAELVTGVKRDIRLLRKIDPQPGAGITVLDISMDSNKEDLIRLLVACSVFYVDHHFAGDIPGIDRLEAHIDPSPDVCTSLIVDRLLKGRYRTWAVVAAFGDNLHETAVQASRGLGLSADQLAQLKELGELMNYNGYGKTVADLHFAPEILYKAVQPYEDPLEFYIHSTELLRLREGFADDMEKARAGGLFQEYPAGRVFMFPGDPWARRVAGVFINEKAREMEDQAHALIVDNNDGTLMISVRAPLSRKTGADNLCRLFPTGGGRAAAAGINALPQDRMELFLRSFSEVFHP